MSQEIKLQNLTNYNNTKINNNNNNNINKNNNKIT